MRSNTPSSRNASTRSPRPFARAWTASRNSPVPSPPPPVDRPEIVHETWLAFGVRSGWAPRRGSFLARRLAHREAEQLQEDEEDQSGRDEIGEVDGPRDAE